MTGKLKLGLGLGLALAVAGTLRLVVGDNTVAVLTPRGIIAHQQRDLMVTAFLLMMLIVVPVFVLTFSIAWRYRASNPKASYQPNWDHNRKLEAIWWGFPSLIILVLSVMTWQSSHAIDPARAIAANGVKPLRVQVVALEWKWLFIYPEQGVASVNELQLPAGRPVEFEVTSDAPMNSFWIPQLGGQIYAMSGMSTRLNLMADTAGTYDGSSANLSGEGFAGMRFKTHVQSVESFNAWVGTAQKSSELTRASYASLSRPTKDNPPTLYSSPAAGLYDEIVMKYMEPPQ